MLYIVVSRKHESIHSQSKHSQHTENSRLEPAIRDAQKLAQNVFPYFSCPDSGSRAESGLVPVLLRITAEPASYALVERLCFRWCCVRVVIELFVLVYEHQN